MKYTVLLTTVILATLSFVVHTSNEVDLRATFQSLRTFFKTNTIDGVKYHGKPSRIEIIEFLLEKNTTKDTAIISIRPDLYVHLGELKKRLHNAVSIHFLDTIKILVHTFINIHPVKNGKDLHIIKQKTHSIILIMLLAYIHTTENIAPLLCLDKRERYYFFSVNFSNENEMFYQIINTIYCHTGIRPFLHNAYSMFKSYYKKNASQKGWTEFRKMLLSYPKDTKNIGFTRDKKVLLYTFAQLYLYQSAKSQDFIVDDYILLPADETCTESNAKRLTSFQLQMMHYMTELSSKNSPTITI